MSDLIQYFEVADVVERELEILGEASNKISARFKNENPEFAWREMKDLRNRVIHDYDAIDPQTIYRVVTHALPGLKERLEKLELPAIQKPVLMPKNIQSLCYCRRRG